MPYTRANHVERFSAEGKELARKLPDLDYPATQRQMGVSWKNEMYTKI